MRIRSCVIPSLSVLTALLLAAPAAAQAAEKKGDPTPATVKKKAPETPRKSATKSAGKRRAPAIPFAVVDMEKAATHTKAFKSGMADGAKQAAAFQKEIEAMKGQIKDLKIQIDMMVEDPARLRKQIDREALISRLNLAGKMYSAELDRQKVLNDGKIYRELSAAVAELASRRGILLVLRKHPHLTIKEMLDKRMVRTKGDAMSRQIRANRQRSVIYHAPDLDLTEDLIKFLKAK